MMIMKEGGGEEEEEEEEKSISYLTRKEHRVIVINALSLKV